MLGRVRYAALRRTGVMVVAALLQLLTVSPSGASLVYCIGLEGHAGIEMLRDGQVDCSGCCRESTFHPSVLASPTDAEDSGCTDILLSSPDVLTPAMGTEPGVLSVPTISHPFSFPTIPTVRLSSLRGFAPTDPPRGSSPHLIRVTVLLI